MSAEEFERSEAESIPQSEDTIAISQPSGEERFGFSAIGVETEESKARRRFYGATEFARLAGVDTGFYTPQYLEQRREKAQAFMNGTPMDGVEPNQVNIFAQRDLYQNRLNTLYYNDFLRESDDVQSREATNQIVMYLERQVPVRGDLPGLYVIANRFPNRFMMNLLEMEGAIQGLNNTDMNSVDKIIELTVKAENWEIMKRTLAGLRAERQRILRDEANTVEVRVGTLGRFKNALKRRFR